MMTVRMRVVNVAVVVAVFRVVIVGMVVVHRSVESILRVCVVCAAFWSVHFPYWLQKEHSQDWLCHQKRTGRNACATSGQFDTSLARIH